MKRLTRERSPYLGHDEPVRLDDLLNGAYGTRRFRRDILDALFDGATAAEARKIGAEMVRKYAEAIRSGMLRKP